MIRAIIDTNVLVQAAISPVQLTSALVLDAYFNGTFTLVWSPATIDELIEVLLIPRIRERHGLSDDEVLDFAASLQVLGERSLGDVEVLPSIFRDITDSKLLALALESKADYLVTNDHRHLLRLGTVGQTQIVGPGEFLRCLSSAE